MTAKRLAAVSPAKINLFLEVTAKRRDGYHDIESVFQAVSLADRLEADLVDGDAVTMECSSPGLPTDERNSVVKAALLLKRAAGAAGGAHFRLDKAIPPEGGLGGGSSNAAAALLLADRLWNTRLSRADLAELAAAVGSDVPFFLHGGACLCRGRGEIITPLRPLAPGRALTLVLSDLRSGTREAYGGLKLPAPGAARRADALIEAMPAGDDGALADAAFNRFEATVFAAIPRLGELHRAVEAIAGTRPRLSGSGASLWLPGPATRIREELARGSAFARFAESVGLRLVETTPAVGIVIAELG